MSSSLDTTGLDAFVGRTTGSLAFGAVAGTILGIGAAPAAVFLASASVISEAINWIGRRVLHIKDSTAPFTRSIIATALSIFAALKVAAFAGYPIATGYAVILSASVPVVSVFALVSFVAIVVIAAAITGARVSSEEV